MNKNNIFKFATKELSQDAFICWLLNNINTKNSEYEEVARKFVELIINKSDAIILKKYIIEHPDYGVNIKRQYKNIDILVEIDKFSIIIEDKVETCEHDDQISGYIQKLIEEGKKKNSIYSCYYKIYDEYKIEDKMVDCVITRQDMIKILKTVENKNLYIQDYYDYLLEIENNSNKRNIKSNEIQNEKSNIIAKVENAIYTGFYRELEKKSNDIIGWGYADNRSGGTWWFASEKYNNIESKEYNSIFAEINLKDNRNSIILKINKKHIIKELRPDETIEEALRNEKDYFENGNVRYYDKNKYFTHNIITLECEKNVNIYVIKY